MVNERKTTQPEASRTLRHKYGFMVDTTRDYMRCPKCYYPIYPDSVAGRFDIVIAYPVEYGLLYWGAVEVKHGGKTSLSFSSVQDKQRIWYEEKKDDYDMWLWFSIGTRISGKKYPRRTWLIPFSLFLELENSLDRKSIPISNEKIKIYELEWAGKRQWIVPEEHGLWENIKNTKKKKEKECS